MALSTQSVVSDGSLVLLDVSIEYLDRSEITVYFDSVPTTTGWAWVGVSDKQISFSPAVPNGVVVLVKRTTVLSELRHEFSLGAAFTAQSLDEGLKQVLHIAQEATESNFSGDFYGDINMHGNRIVNIGTAVNDTDALSLAQYKADALGAYTSKNQAYTYMLAAQQAADDAVTQVGGVLRAGDTMTGMLTLAGNASSALHAVPLQQVNSLVTTALQAMYPVGSIYINAASAVNPATLLGFGTWEAFGTGRVLLGYDGADALFNTVGNTGGSKDAVAVSHFHTASAANAGAHSHTITDPGHTHSYNMASGDDQPLGSGAGIVQYNSAATTGSKTTGITVDSVVAHTHVLTVDASGVSGTNANLQPYIVVYMWTRTA